MKVKCAWCGVALPDKTSHGMCSACEAATIKSIEIKEKKRHVIFLEAKHRFLSKHQDLVEMALEHREPVQKQNLADRARQELGYSTKTTNEDILRSLLAVYFKYIKQQITPNDPKQVWLNKEAVL